MAMKTAQELAHVIANTTAKEDKMKIKIILTSFILLAALAFGGLFSAKSMGLFEPDIDISNAALQKTAGIVPDAPSTLTKNKKKKDAPVKITISAAGDCTLGVDSRYNSIFNEYYARHGSSYFLQSVKKIFAKDDLTIVNLEGTFTESTNRANKAFTFKGHASYVDILKKGSVEIVNTANNHTLDFGAQGYSDTIKTLKDNKIKYCDNDKIAYEKVKGVKIAFLGFNQLAGVTQATVKETIDKAKANGAKLIIASFHWGIERDYYPNASQESLARFAIDNGASLVLGHHPHVLQGIELYKGRYIVYSLGNFCFGGNSNPTDKDTMIFRQTFTIKKQEVKKDKNITVYPCSLSSVPYTNDFQPKILSGTEAARVLDKINRLSAGRSVKL